jgi:PilZ domain
MPKSEKDLIERRAGSRHTCEQPNALTILVRPKMQKYKVTVFDISATGISFLLEVALPEGTVLALQRQILIPGQSWIRSGKVMHASQRGDKWLIGCELTPPFSVDELSALR